MRVSATVAPAAISAAVSAFWEAAALGCVNTTVRGTVDVDDDDMTKNSNAAAPPASSSNSVVSIPPTLDLLLPLFLCGLFFAAIV
jgi:hypothetical protein